MLSNSQKLGGAAEHLTGISKNTFIALALNFRVCMLLKGAVMGITVFHVALDGVIITQ